MGQYHGEGRQYFQIKPGLIFLAGFECCSLCILGSNLLGDTARDIA